jgi:hypothetical protein
MQEAKLEKPEYLVQSFANEEPPDVIKGLLHVVQSELPAQGIERSLANQPHVALGTMSTLPLIKKALAEGQLSIQLYTDFFGPSAYKRLAITQQTDCRYGQSWPELVWIPMCYFFDTTVRHQMGMDWGDRGYWKSVTSHEVAHQWWGHTVGFNSYRDQWMSEGFAELSASLYLQLIEKNPKKFIEFWNDQRELLLERDKEGWRAIDAGPVTMGYRMSNTRTGESITRRLIWFFNEYVYGTALPGYKFSHSFEKDSAGDVVFNFKLMQSNVAESFRMLVPIYVELADGRVAPLGRARLSGNSSVEQKIPLKGLKDVPRRALINYYDGAGFELKIRGRLL